MSIRVSSPIEYRRRRRRRHRWPVGNRPIGVSAF